MTSSSTTNKVYWQFLIPLAVLKMAVHIFTNTVTKYGLHRDEYLYISDSDHLAWGYMEMPPMLAVVGKIARLLFGDTLFAVRFFPASDFFLEKSRIPILFFFRSTPCFHTFKTVPNDPFYTSTIIAFQFRDRNIVRNTKD